MPLRKLNIKYHLAVYLFGWLWLVADVGLLWKKNTTGWLLVGGWC